MVRVFRIGVNMLVTTLGDRYLALWSVTYDLKIPRKPHEYSLCSS